MVVDGSLEMPDAPILLEPNTVPSFYGGAGRIGKWRHVETSPSHPEDWIASTSRRTGMADKGLTTLANGTILADAISADPVSWLGPEHVERHGPSTGMLLKLLDAGERLPVHIHPDGHFAKALLGQPNGKAEAWIVLEAEPGASVHLGFRRDLSEDELERLVESQDIPALLGVMNKVFVQPGDVLYCPPGVPHAIGADILVIEVQEPSDNSIMLEWSGFPIRSEDRFLGLERRAALAAADRSGYSGDRLRRLRGRAVTSLTQSVPGAATLLPSSAARYFTAEQIIPAEGLEIGAALSVLFVLEGTGSLNGDTFGAIPIHEGQTWLLPWAAGPVTLAGAVSVVRCCPA